MFELQITDSDVTTGSIPVSWCVDKLTLSEITETVGIDPQVVIIIAPTEKYHITKEIRKVVPLRDLMTYLSFKVSGPNRIWAFVTELSAKEAKHKYLGKKSSGEFLDVLSPDGTEWGYYFRQSAIKNNRDVEWYEPHWGSFIDVNVPVTAFAPEPPEWEKTWVNHFFTTNAFDQCNFRRRRIFAYTIQPVIMVLQLMLRLIVTLTALLIGAKGFSLQPLLHPMNHSLTEQFAIFTKGSIFIRKLPDDDDRSENPAKAVWWLARKIVFIPLMPPILAFIILSLAVEPLALITIVGFIFSIFLFCGFLGLMTYLFGEGGWNSFVDWLELKFSTVPIEMSEEETQLLVCSPDRKPVTMNSLPDKKKTIRLRFLDLKSKVCKPFSG